MFFYCSSGLVLLVKCLVVLGSLCGLTCSFKAVFKSEHYAPSLSIQVISNQGSLEATQLHTKKPSPSDLKPAISLSVAVYQSPPSSSISIRQRRAWSRPRGRLLRRPAAARSAPVVGLAHAAWVNYQFRFAPCSSDPVKYRRLGSAEFVVCGGLAADSSPASAK